MFSNILVAYDGSPTSRSALAKAYELAQTASAKVTVLTVAPTVAPLAALAPVSLEGLRAELDQWATTRLGEAEAAAPAGLAIRTVQRRGHVGQEVVAELELGGYDLVVLGSRGHGRLSSEILGSVNADVHYHVKVPTLTIDATEPDEGEQDAGQSQRERPTSSRPAARVG